LMQEESGVESRDIPRAYNVREARVKRRERETITTHQSKQTLDWHHLEVQHA